MGQFGEFFKAKRIALGKTLRQFCLENELDPGNISKLERGLFSPPQHEKLQEYAKLLGLKEGTDDWYQFFDLAAAEAGKIPQDILNDEEVVEKLPVLFRALRGKEVSKQRLDKLVDRIKKEPLADNQLEGLATMPHPKIDIPQRKLVEFCRNNHIHKLSFFGSVLRNDFRPDSDVDVLVEFEPGYSAGLIRLAGMELELSKILKRKVDLRTSAELSRYFRQKVLESAKVQYAQR